MPGKRRSPAPANPRRSSSRRSQPVLIIAVVVALACLAGVLTFHYTTGTSAAATFVRPPVALQAVQSTAPTPTASPTPTEPLAADPLVIYQIKTSFPQSGPGTFRYATTTGPVLGTAGNVRKFHVAIESNVGENIVEMASFVAKIDATLGDSRSWVGGATYRLQQVAENVKAEFTIYLATPQTTNHLCAPLPSNGYTSCRQGAKVVLNLARYQTSVPYYRDAKVVLDTYRTYMINHETGHALGHGHELCPGSGKPAPVMEQQTLGLHGCVPNPWVYINGKRYDGPSGVY
jgi:hypothetical protein